MKNRINVKGIQVYAYHGCLDEEKRLGGKYTVNVEIAADFSKAVQTDALEDTVDYVAIRKIVIAEMAIRSRLIEHVGQRIYKRLKNELQFAEGVSITVIKHNPPIEGVVENVSILISDF